MNRRIGAGKRGGQLTESEDSPVSEERYLHRERRREYRLRFLITVTLIALIFIPGRRHFEIDVLDVGQGDGIYFCTGKANLFLDGGSTSNRSVGQYTIVPFLKCKGVRQVDYWLVSHADQDHVSGLEYALENGYPIKNLVVSAALAGSTSDGGSSAVAGDNSAIDVDENMAELLALAETYGVHVIRMQAGDTIAFPNDKITCLYPTMQDTSDSVNDLCLVFTYEHSGKQASGGKASSGHTSSNDSLRGMFAGDISSETEQKIIERYADNMSVLDVDFYKVDHHGSRYSSCKEWLAALSPENAAISCGKDNSYGHPHADTLERLQEEGIEYLRTDQVGEIKVVP